MRELRVHTVQFQLQELLHRLKQHLETFGSGVYPLKCALRPR